MLRWTAAGAVESPTTVQIRVQRSYPGRIRAGAPLPTRSMDATEIAENIRHFTVGHRTPRTRPCTGLVLSGVGVAGRPDTPGHIDLARSEGVERVVLHVGPEDLAGLEPATWRDRVDTVVLPLRPGAELAAAVQAAARLTAAGLSVATHTVLDADALPHLGDVVAALVRLPPHRHTFTFPFPTSPDVVASAPDSREVVARLLPSLTNLDRAGVPAAVKGLPACHLERYGHLVDRTGNRWYVDADHQRDDALLFLPDVVAFHKDDACRFCRRSDDCDGFFREWLARPGTPPLSPL